MRLCNLAIGFSTRGLLTVGLSVANCKANDRIGLVFLSITRVTYSAIRASFDYAHQMLGINNAKINLLGGVFLPFIQAGTTHHVCLFPDQRLSTNFCRAFSLFRSFPALTSIHCLLVRNMEVCHSWETTLSTRLCASKLHDILDFL